MCGNLSLYKIQVFQMWFWITLPGCATPRLAKLWSLLYISPPNYAPSDTCPWHVGWHQPQNSTDSCFFIPEEVSVEESWRQADSLVNFRICFIPFSSQPRCFCLNAWLWVLLWTSVSFSLCSPKGKWFVCQWKSNILIWNKGPFIFPTILRHFYAAKVEVKTRIHT